MSTLYYYKSPNTLTNQDTHNFPQLGTLEWWKVLTWPSEGIWPTSAFREVLSFCVVQVLFRALEDHMTYCWFFGIINWRRLWEILATFKPYCHFLDKELHCTYSLDGDHQQRSGRQAATHYPGEASPNPHSHSGTSHQTESRPRGTTMVEERSDGYPRGRTRRYQH